jgi:two-component system, sensor histidine kinase LadS
LVIVLFNLKSFLYCIIFLSNFAYGNSPCILENTFKYDSCKKELEIFIDINDRYKTNNEKPSYDKFTQTDKTFLGHIRHEVWTKLDVKYIGKNEANVIFINPKVMIDEINVFIYKNGNLIKEQLLGDTHSINEREIKSRYSSFSVKFEQNDEITIISRIHHKGAFEVSWLISQTEEFQTFMIKESTFIGIIVGILLALIFYNFIIYIRIKDKLYLMYVFHAITVLLFQITSTNLFFEYGLVMPSYSAWIIGYLSIATLMVFTKYFFITKNTMPFLNRLLNFFIFSSLFFTLYFILTPYFSSLMVISKWILFITIPLILFFVITISIVSLYKKLNGATYYLFGQIGYLICFMYPQISNILTVELTFISMYIATFGVLFDTLFLSLALSYKLKILKTEKEDNEKFLYAQASFSNTGKTLANISHQYKTPLAHLSILVTSLEAHLFKTNNEDILLKDISNNMRKSLNFMNETMNNFNKFYQNSKEKESFNILNQIESIEKMLQEKITTLDVKIYMQIDKEIEYIGYKNSFDNVIMILLDNALEVFEQNKIKNPIINIKIEKSNEQLTLSIEDNAGGIKVKPIDLIFETFITTKEKSNGLGLSMCKLLVENKLNGKICVFNNEEGATFFITL